MKLSIIIPVYNVQEYLGACLDSIFNQDIPYYDYEVILVNDGSPDNSESIILEYSAKFPNIKYIKQENGGPSRARNTGLEEASGDYIWFIDSDDWIKSNCLNDLLTYNYTNNLDFCEFSFSFIYESDEVQINTNAKIENHVIDNIEYISNYPITLSACMHIVKKEILEDYRIRFIPDIYQEDTEINIRILEYSKRISYFNGGSIYFYRKTNPNSTMTNKNLAHIKQRMNSYIFILKEWDNQYGKSPKYSYGYYVGYVYNKFLYEFLSVSKNLMLKKGGLRYYRNLIRNNSIKFKLEPTSNFEKIKHTILNTCIDFFFFTYILNSTLDFFGNIFRCLRKYLLRFNNTLNEIPK